MASKRGQPDTSQQAKLPVFRKITDIKATPRVPVIAYFTAKQWKAAMNGIETSPQTELVKGIPTVRHQAAPWGNGDIIVYQDMSIIDRLRLKCKPNLKVIGAHGKFVISFGFICEPVTVGTCELIILAFPGEIPDGVSPWRCDNINCTGTCRLVHVGTQAEGEFQCACK